MFLSKVRQYTESLCIITSQNNPPTVVGGLCQPDGGAFGREHYTSTSAWSACSMM